MTTDDFFSLSDLKVRRVVGLEAVLANKHATELSSVRLARQLRTCWSLPVTPSLPWQVRLSVDSS